MKTKLLNHLLSYVLSDDTLLLSYNHYCETHDLAPSDLNNAYLSNPHVYAVAQTLRFNDANDEDKLAFKSGQVHTTIEDIENLLKNLKKDLK